MGKRSDPPGGTPDAAASQTACGTAPSVSEPCPGIRPGLYVRPEPATTAAASRSGSSGPHNTSAPETAPIPHGNGPHSPSSPDGASALLTPDARRQRVFDWLDARGIRYTWYEHPEAPTCEIALRYCRDDGARHCKNLFFRNHKGDRHYLVCFDAERRLAIRDLEQRLRQGKLTFASEQRMERWLGVRPVSVFGLINDPAHHVHLFLDARMRDRETFAFHPNDNRATVVLPHAAFLHYLAAVGCGYEYVELY